MSRPKSHRTIALLAWMFPVSAFLMLMVFGSGGFWVGVLVLVTDLYLVSLLVLLAEQISSTVNRKRRQLSLKTLFQLMAATGIYLGVARFASLHIVPPRMLVNYWIGLCIGIGLMVVLTLPLVLVVCEKVVWLAVDWQRYRRGSPSPGASPPLADFTTRDQ